MKIYAGLDLGGSSLKYGYGNSKRGMIFFRRAFHQNEGRKKLYDLLSSVILDIKDEIGPTETLQAVTLGSPGFIDPEKGHIIDNCPNLKDWCGANPKKFLEDSFSIPVFVENDANIMTYGEAQRDEIKGKPVLGITIGTGIGSGFVNANCIYRGNSWAALELGHTIVVRNGRKCSCGKRGCLEAYSSVPAIERSAAKLLKNKNYRSEKKGSSLSAIEEILRQYNNDRKIAMLLNRTYDLLGLAIANSVVLLDPEAVVIGGGLTECDGFQLKPVSESIKKYLNRYQIDNLSIMQAVFKNRAGVWGGIILAENKFKEIMHAE